ncbi:MAG: VWA domain-containing protein [Roseovarius sp.]|nr:VWA domain-containing protein [Roseovarius sp.]
MNDLPAAARPFVEFPAALRAGGFAVSPDQTIGFIEAVGLLGPDSIADVRAAAIAMLAIPNERMEEFDSIFRAFFYGEVAAGAFEDKSDEVEAHEPTGAIDDEQISPEDEEAGDAASILERLGHRNLIPGDNQNALDVFSRLAPLFLPRRLTRRFQPQANGRLLDMRATMRKMARNHGETFELAKRKRKTRLRKIVLLIDISGSMTELTENSLRFAHTLCRCADRMEAFTLGTRLTRITRALRLGNEMRAFARVSGMVADMDGGTRIGEALEAYISVPRYAGFARGALVLMLSDGLERGGTETMESSVRKLSELAWRIEWLSPLAAKGSRPETAGMAAIMPHLSSLGDASSLEAMTSHVISRGRAR